MPSLSSSQPHGSLDRSASLVHQAQSSSCRTTGANCIDGDPRQPVRAEVLIGANVETVVIGDADTRSAGWAANDLSASECCTRARS